MTKLDIEQVKSNFSQLLDLAIEGEEIIITQDDKPVAQISPIKRALKRGSAKGKVLMSPDFDEPLEYFQEYTE
ncbi:type II toxin-antitoxin system Phd/YefM family antitoxin [Aphanothece sacrum]|uniref:Antitoxin n=1 Tax=Aphanothece sacrum FPU1 TaxID=1920663 RepID=A0A401IFP1_APHSA|nr:type II toxin-antitoxin system Phd/YefM family antitoxin [Aphanothece sacrum]GBF80098.1 prevent-host-death family protein [Aphanothece sacrum FPU1]GBF86064.1 prevent-host-death family protein [Aphanothece sacrum FPU3]